MTKVPTGVRPDHFNINMMGRSGVNGNGRGREEGQEEDGGEQQQHGGRQAEGARTEGEDEEEVAGLFGNFSEEEEQEQQPRRTRRRREGAQEGQAEGGEEPEQREEVPPPPNVHLPVAPGQEEWDEHFRTHINFRSWCPVCVEARGRENPHYRKKERVRPGLP